MRSVRSDFSGGYTLETAGIRVTVVPFHVAEDSDVLEGCYAFAYSVSIENLSDEPVRLLERHWMITSGGSHLAEIVGPGVLGEQPLIEVGESFEYTGSTVIQDPVGAMEGTYTFRSQSGMFFEVPVPKFDLHYPLTIH